MLHGLFEFNLEGGASVLRTDARNAALGSGARGRVFNREGTLIASSAVRDLQNLVSARPWPGAASPRAPSALRIQWRRTNRDRSPGYGICKQRLNRRARRLRGSPQTEQRQGIRSGWGRARFVNEAVGPTAGPSPISRDQPPAQGIPGHLTRCLRGHGCAMMPRRAEDSAPGAGRIATRRLDADDRVRESTVRPILRVPQAKR